MVKLGRTIGRILSYKWPILCIICFVFVVSMFYTPKERVVVNIPYNVPAKQIQDSHLMENKDIKPAKSKSDPSYSKNAAAKRFKTRLQHLRKECDSHQGNHLPLRHEWKANSNFLVDVPSRLLICAVPKSGSTTWHRTVWAIRRKRAGQSTAQDLYTPKDTIRNQGMATKLSRDNGNILIRQVSGDDIFWKNPPPESSFRLILARHPFARLISGWNQKFLLKSNYWVYLFKTYPRLLDYRKKLDDNRVMAFEDFAQYIADNGLNIGMLDFHFVPAYYHCKPCEYDFTYVLKAESVDIDEDWLYNRLNLTDFNIGRKGVPPGGSAVNDDVVGNIKKYMSTLKPEVVAKLYRVYHNDFTYLGYTFNLTSLEAGGFE